MEKKEKIMTIEEMEILNTVDLKKIKNQMKIYKKFLRMTAKHVRPVEIDRRILGIHLYKYLSNWDDNDNYNEFINDLFSLMKKKERKKKIKDWR